MQNPCSQDLLLVLVLLVAWTLVGRSWWNSHQMLSRRHRYLASWITPFPDASRSCMVVCFLPTRPTHGNTFILQTNTNVLVRIAASSDEHAMGLAIYMWPSVLQMSNCVTIILMTSDGKMIQPPYLKWWIKGKSWRRVGKKYGKHNMFTSWEEIYIFYCQRKGVESPTWFITMAL